MVDLYKLNHWIKKSCNINNLMIILSIKKKNWKQFVYILLTPKQPTLDNLAKKKTNLLFVLKKKSSK